MSVTDDPAPRPAETIAALRRAGFKVEDATTALRLAANLVEFTAYENAEAIPPARTGQMMMLAAMLAAMADRSALSRREIDELMEALRTFSVTQRPARH